MIDELERIFEERFHLALPPEFSRGPLKPAGDGPLLSTNADRLPQLLMSPVVPARLHELEPGHNTVGFWGYGSNSYAFYFISSLPREKVYLRLPTGGVYTDPAAASADITDFLPVLLFLLREVRRLGGRVVAIQSMGTGEFAMECNGHARRLRCSLLGRPHAMDHVRQLIDSVLQIAPDFDPAPLREKAMAVAQAVYLEESRFQGNERVGMRALGSAMNVIRQQSLARSAAALQVQVLMGLAGLAERHLDSDGEHERGRRAIDTLIGRLKADWMQPPS